MVGVACAVHRPGWPGGRGVGRLGRLRCPGRPRLWMAAQVAAVLAGSGARGRCHRRPGRDHDPGQTCRRTPRKPATRGLAWRVALAAAALCRPPCCTGASSSPRTDGCRAARVKPPWASSYRASSRPVSSMPGSTFPGGSPAFRRTRTSPTCWGPRRPRGRGPARCRCLALAAILTFVGARALPPRLDGPKAALLMA